MQYPHLLLAFDIETSEQAQDNKISPITVASTVTLDGDKRAWFSHPTDKSIVGMIGRGQDEDWSNFSPDGQLAPLMSKETALAMLKYMEEKQNQGYSLCAWNGAGFDLKMIGFLAGDVELAGRMALDLIDPMYQVLSMKGYPVGLSAVQKGLGTEQAKSMSGADAPDAWANGEYQKVISYVIGDSEMTVEIIQAIAKVGGIKWMAKSGKPNSLMLQSFKTVAECLMDPEPNNSWMDKPINRRDIIAWIPEESKLPKSDKPRVVAKKSKNTSSTKTKPVLLVISGPSGVGKSVICTELGKMDKPIEKVITFTTRKPRDGESDTISYNFVNDIQFDQMVKAGDFLEYAEVHGSKYGSTKISVSTKLAKGQDVVMILDVKGAEQVRAFFKSLPEATQSKFRQADVFVMPPSMNELRNRLVTRGTDSPENIEQRLLTAKVEMAQASSYRYTIVNDDLDNAVDKIDSIIVAEKCIT
jgi:guanylate kinase